jgi:hypothetical protein
MENFKKIKKKKILEMQKNSKVTFLWNTQEMDTDRFLGNKDDKFN